MSRSSSASSVWDGQKREASPRASMDEALKSEAAFMQYLSSIPPSEHHRSADSMTAAPPAAVSKVGLDHLDNLCKLMEQLGELRDTNSKLQRRVQYLEDLKTLHDMHKEICEETPPAGPFPLKKSATESSCPRKPSKCLSRRSRQPQGESQRRGRSKSVGHEDPKSRRLFPKWSRLKEAFGWESERKGSIKEKSELRRRSDESSGRHPGSPTWYRNFPSIHSSVEDIREEFEGLEPKSFTLERDSYLEKEDGKRGKSPWGRVKTIIERHRDSIKRRSLRHEPDLASAFTRDDLESTSKLPPRQTELEVEVEEGCPRTPNSSPVLQRRSKWTRMTKALKGSSTPTTPTNPHDGHFTFDVIEESSTSPHGDELTADLLVQLQRNLSEDFHRKIQEWERMRSTPQSSDAWKGRKKPEPVKPKIKDLSWLEKELQKVEKEQQRLAKERVQFEQRALRLRKLRETVVGREVRVRTAAGEFRFEGISDAFTKKLYEWETQRGVGPDHSTIALLNEGGMQRMLSKSESSIADIGAANPSAKPSDGANHLSRADSEPTLAAAFGNNLTDPMLQREEQRFGVLEENVLLLERLKEKEEICRRLEKDLQILEEMNRHHSKETQRYREKLWDLHQQAAGPREVLCCRRTMDQLRQRIEALERWTRKLRSERETVEANFRHHSKEQESMTLDLLERMRELQAVGSSTAESESDRPSSRLDSEALERLRDISGQLHKQTHALQETLCRKTLQIRQLKWELLHRDLSSVKRETEGHSHQATKKRSNYAHWRSRSSEEPPCPLPSTQHPERVISTPDSYCVSSSPEEFQADHLARTVQQLSEEVHRLASSASLTRDGKILTSMTMIPKDFETCKSHSKRRNSADNSTDDRESSSDEYFSRVCYNVPNGSDVERLLMSYGENLPRTARKKRLQKASKLNSTLGRRRSNTFHTNRDLQKPLIVENAPQKCHSFRVPRENYNEDSAIVKTPYFRRKLQMPNLDVRAHSRNSGVFREADPLGKDCIREAASDSKILMRVKKCADPLSEKSRRRLPVRSMSDSTRTEEAEGFQKRKLKKRLKIPPNLTLTLKDEATAAEGIDVVLHHGSDRPKVSQKVRSPEQTDLQMKPETSKSEFHNDRNEIPTITIQFPKRKHRKPLSIEEETAEDRCVTIVVPKKRSFSSECDSSISESSPREEPRLQHSDNSNTDNAKVDVRKMADQKHSPAPDHKDPLSSSSNSRSNASSIGNIQMLKLVSLEDFENPFDQNKDPNQTESQARKRKSQDGDGNPPTEEMVDMINAGQHHSLREESHGLASSATAIAQRNSENAPPSTNYIKSPSAPQLDWRKACAKKISRTGAPNVRTLIERYNQKVIESQIFTSPSSSNVSSPATSRKTSTPVNSSCPRQYAPHFSSTPNTPTTVPSYSYLDFKTCSCPKTPPSSPLSVTRSEALRKATAPSCSSLDFKTCHCLRSPPSSPLSVARSEALRKAKEDFIASPQLSTRTVESASETSAEGRPWTERQRTTKSDEDGVSHSSMDSMNLVMLRAGESCRESRMPKKSAEPQKAEPVEAARNLKASLSSSSLFKAVLHSDFKVPANLLKLKRSKRKKDMSAVTELCRQSLLLTSEDAPNVLAPSSHKSCPSSPELKAKTAKPNWLQRNIFRHK